MIKKYIILIVLFAVVLNIVLAEPPFSETIVSQAGLVIVYPQFLYYPINKQFNITFDVLNSTYYRLTNTTTDCSYWVFNNAGSNITSGDLTYYATEKYWKLQIQESDALSGIYNIYVHCNSTSEKGFSNFGYQVIGDGNVTDPSYNLSAVIFLVCFGSLLVVVGLYIYFNKTEK